MRQHPTANARTKNLARTRNGYKIIALLSRSVNTRDGILFTFPSDAEAPEETDQNLDNRIEPCTRRSRLPPPGTRGQHVKTMYAR